MIFVAPISPRGQTSLHTAHLYPAFILMNAKREQSPRFALAKLLVDQRPAAAGAVALSALIS